MSTETKKKAKRGRKPLAKGEGKSLTIIIRVALDEKKRAIQTAKAENKTVSDWARAKLGLAW